MAIWGVPGLRELGIWGMLPWGTPVFPAADIRLTRSGSTIADGAGDALGDVDAGGTAYVYTLHNDGADALTVASVASSALSNVTSATVSGISTPVVVAPGGSTTFTVTVTPTAAGACSYTLTVTSDDPDAEAVYTVSVSGTGTGFEALYEAWTQLRYSHFGSGAPDLDPFTEYTSCTEDASGFDVTGSFSATLRDGVTEQITWHTAITDVWADAPTDHTLALLGDVSVGASSAGIGASLVFGLPATANAAVGGGVAYRSSTERYGYAQDASTGSQSIWDGTPGRARVLLVPWPGSAYTRAGMPIALPRTAANVALAKQTKIIAATTSADVTGTSRVGVAVSAMTAVSGTRNLVDGKVWAKGALVPYPSWDGGVVGTDPGQWRAVPFPGGAPAEDADVRYVSDAGAADLWEITLNSAVLTGDGWARDAIWLPDVSAALADMSGATAVLIEIELDPTSAMGAGEVIEAGFRWSAAAAGYAVGMWLNSGTNMASAGDEKTGVVAGSGSTTYNRGIVGGVCANVGSTGSKYPGGMWALIHSATSPGQSLTPMVRGASAGTAAFTGDWEFFVGVRHRTIGIGNKTLKFKVKVCPLFDTSEDAA